jgi:hypothetical protein
MCKETLRPAKEIITHIITRYTTPAHLARSIPLTPTTHHHIYRLEPCVPFVPFVPSDRRGSCLSKVLKARVRGVNGVAEVFAAPDICGCGHLLFGRTERRDPPSCSSSEPSFWVARSPSEGIMDQIPNRRLRRKMNLQRLSLEQHFQVGETYTYSMNTVTAKVPFAIRQ